MFVDEVDIHVAAGDGGRGCLSFRREKSAPRGGPDGGDGGRGGSVYLTASPHLNTLVTFRFHPTYKATRGAHGEGSNRTGRDGEDLELGVPVGTVAYEQTADALVQIADLTEGGMITGAGGGGFALFIAKDGQTAALREKLNKLRKDAAFAKSSVASYRLNARGIQLGE